MPDEVSGKAPAHPKRCCIEPSKAGKQQHTEQGAELVLQHSLQHHIGKQAVLILPRVIVQGSSAFPLSSRICPLEYF